MVLYTILHCAFWLDIDISRWHGSCLVILAVVGQAGVSVMVIVKFAVVGHAFVLVGSQEGVSIPLMVMLSVLLLFVVHGASFGGPLDGLMGGQPGRVPVTR